MKNKKKTKSPKKPMGLRRELFKTSVSRPGLKQLEEELKLFKDPINQSNDAIAVVEPETGRFLYVNDKVCSNLGYSRGELLNMKVVDIEAILPDSFSWNKHVEEVKSKGYVILEGKHKRKDGTTFPVWVNVKYLTQNKKDYMVAIIRDITGRKQAEEKIRKLNEELEQKVIERTEKLKETNSQLKGQITARDILLNDLKLFRNLVNQSNDALVFVT